MGWWRLIHSSGIMMMYWQKQMIYGRLNAVCRRPHITINEDKAKVVVTYTYINCTTSISGEAYFLLINNAVQIWRNTVTSIKL